MGDAGIIACLVASEPNAPVLFERWGVKLPGGVTAAEYDPFHAMILSEELKLGTRGMYGVMDGLIGESRAKREHQP